MNTNKNKVTVTTKTRDVEMPENTPNLHFKDQTYFKDFTISSPDSEEIIKVIRDLVNRNFHITKLNGGNGRWTLDAIKLDIPQQQMSRSVKEKFTLLKSEIEVLKATIQELCKHTELDADISYFRKVLDTKKKIYGPVEVKITDKE